MNDLRIPPAGVTRPLVRVGLTVALMATLAGCGGGGATTPATTDPTIPAPGDGGTPGTPATPGTPETGAQMRTSATSLIADFSPIRYTALGSVPTTGSAVYNGYLYGTLANTTDAVTDSVIGDMAMTVAFNASSVTVSGNVSNFAAADDTALTGTLTLSAGSLNRGGNPSNDATLTVAANGTLTDSASRDLAIGAQLEGDFLGTTHDGVGGEALGRVTVNGVSQDFDGGFIAER